MRVEDLEKSREHQRRTTHMSSLAAWKTSDRLWLICPIAKTDARSVGPSGGDAHEPGRELPVVDTAPALAGGTAGVELAGKAERAITANPEALEPWAYDEAGRQAETPPQEHE